MERSGWSVCARAVAAALFVVVSAAQAIAEKRIALVVGNAAYRNIARLDNPGNDAKLMADTLRSLSFTVISGGAQLDLDEPAMRRAVQAFGKELPGADVALFFYAGHGLQVRGNNYLAPVDANPVREADVDFQMLDTNVVLRQMESAGARLNIVILDACRNNPFAGAGLRAAVGGLAQMQAPRGTLISFATQPGNVAQDGVGNSPFTRALAQTIQKPGLDIFRTFNEVGLAVSEATGGSQQPWLSLSPIRGDFFFGGAQAAAPVKAQPPSPSGAALAPWTCEGKCVDAGIRLPGNRAYLFRRGQYARFSGDAADKGYPLPIAGYWAFPESWSTGIDAAVDWGGGRVYFFKGDHYLRYDSADGKETTYTPLPIATHWPGLPKSWASGINAGVNWGDGKVYFFKGNQYLRYDIKTDTVDPGYPRPIAGNWGGFPPSWSSGIDAAMNWGNGIVYFFKGDQYVRYDIKTGTSDSSYYPPRPVVGNWQGFR